MRFLAWLLRVWCLFVAVPSLAQDLPPYRLPDRGPLDQAIGGRTVEIALAQPLTSAALLAKVNQQVLRCEKLSKSDVRSMRDSRLECAPYFSQVEVNLKKQIASSFDVSQELCKSGRADSCTLAAMGIGIADAGLKFNSPEAQQNFKSILAILDRACALGSGLGCARLNAFLGMSGPETCCRKGRTKSQVDAFNKGREANVWYLHQRACSTGLVPDCDYVASAHASGDHGLPVDKLKAARMFLANCEKSSNLAKVRGMFEQDSCEALFKQLGIKTDPDHTVSSKEEARFLLSVEDARTLSGEVAEACKKGGNFLCLLEAVNFMLGSTAVQKDKSKAATIFDQLCGQDMLWGCVAAVGNLVDGSEENVDRLSAEDKQRFYDYRAKACKLGAKELCEVKAQ